MNILHHKSYHVYNKKNIERVRKDEAEAEAKAKEKQDRVVLAESEARLNLLRARADAKLPAAARSTDRVEHVNLFQDLLVTNNKNEEREAEMKAKDEKWGKQITMYLDKGAKKEEEPWYAKNEAEDQKYIDKCAFKRKEDKDSKRRKRDPIKLLEDPLDMINSRLKDREKKEKERRYHDSESSKSSSKHHSSSSSSSRKHKESKHKHEKEETSSPSIAELRAKRLERERNEQVRVKQLYLGPNIPDKEEEEEEEEMDDRKRGYNSQFNRDETNQAKNSSSRKKRRH